MGTAMSSLFVDPKELPGGDCVPCYTVDHNGTRHISEPWMKCDNYYTSVKVSDHNLHECGSDGGDVYGLIQILFLLAVYFKILGWASDQIAEGSELLLLIPAIRGLVGSVVLPILGAVPDGAMVLFSCIGKDAKTQINVGIGALCGSTIMLITIPWFLAILAGRVNMVKGVPYYALDKTNDKQRLNVPKLLAGKTSLVAKASAHLFQTGVALRSEINTNGLIMVATSMCYLVIQIPAFVELSKYNNNTVEAATAQATAEKPWILASLIVCMMAFTAYLVYMFIDNMGSGDEGNSEKGETDIADMKLRRLQGKALDNGLVTIGTLFHHSFDDLEQRESSEKPLLEGDAAKLGKMKAFLGQKFNQYDTDHNGTLDSEELQELFKDLFQANIGGRRQSVVSVRESKADFSRFKSSIDADGDGVVTKEEFYNSFIKVMLGKRLDQNRQTMAPGVNTIYEDEEDGEAFPSGAGGDDDADGEADDEDNEDVEMPEDLEQYADNPKEQMRRVIYRSLYMMALGTIVVLLVSDPTVDVMSDLGTRIGISPFVVSFLLAPLASNAGELVAAYSYAKKKTKATMAVSLSTLEGAGIMNNTFTTAIFFFGIYINTGIEWAFTCETIGIIAVQIVVALYAQKKVMTMFDACLILSLFPLSLAGIMLLKNYTNLDPTH